MLDKENHAEHQADRAHDDVRVSQKGVFSADPRGGREHYVLLSRKGRNGVVGTNDDGVVRVGLEGRVDDAVQFLEVRETRRPHPHDEILVLEIGYNSDARGIGWRVLEFRFQVGAPCNSVLPQWDRCTIGFEEREGVIKQAAGNQTAWEVK